MKSTASIYTETLLNDLNLEWKAEYKFHPDRRWRADYYTSWYEPTTPQTHKISQHLLASSDYPAELKKHLRILIEIEGGTWTRGRHNRPQGYANDCEKYNQAQILGFTVLRYTPSMILNGDLELDLKQLLK